MFTFQMVFGAALVLCLLAVAGVTAWLQLVFLRGDAAEGEDARHERGRARRRLYGSAVMVVLALMLLAALLFLEVPAQQLAAQGPIAAEDPEHTTFRRLYAWFWIVFLLLLLLLLVIAAVDFWVVRRYGQRQMRRLQEDRRTMVARQSARMRRDRQQERD